MDQEELIMNRSIIKNIILGYPDSTFNRVIKFTKLSDGERLRISNVWALLKIVHTAKKYLSLMKQLHHLIVLPNATFKKHKYS